MSNAHLIEGYRNLPGEHCGSTAMRNLLFHYCSLDLTEGEVFGLGSGIDFVLLETDLYQPGVMLFGRGATMETDFADALGMDYREEVEPEDAVAWKVVREEVLAGRPTMLSGDALYLDYRDFKVHFPAHRFVLLGFDDDAQVAYVADRIVPEIQACTYAALAKSRNPPDFISTFNLWGKFRSGQVGRTIEEAMEIAIARSARRMLGETTATSSSPAQPLSPEGLAKSNGVAGLETLARQLPDWSRRDDFPRFARYGAACIESFGTGGGNFRNLYSRFLESAHRRLPDMVRSADLEAMRRSAAAWTELSRQLAAAGLADETERSALVAAMQQTARSIAETETRVFGTLAERAGLARSACRS